MIGKVTTGTNFKGLLQYLQKQDAELVTKNILGEDPNQMTKEFMMVSQQNSKVEKPVKHFVLSFSGEDKERLNPDILQKITKGYLKKMGYENNQFVAYKHNDTDHTHLHIAVNRVDMNLKGVNDSFEKRRSREVMRSFEKQYGLTVTAEAGQGKDSNYSIHEKFQYGPNGYKVGFSEEGKKELSKEIFRTIKDNKIKTFEDLRSKLSEKDIDMELKNNGKNIAFGQEGIMENGGALYKKLSHHYITQEFRKNSLLELKKNIKAALKDNKRGKEEFFKYLQKEGIQIKMNPSNTGYSFIKDGHNFKASQVDRKLTLARIDNTLKDYTQKNVRKYVGDTFYHYMKKDSAKDFKDYFNSKGITAHVLPGGKSKFMLDNVVVNEKDLGGIVSREGLEKILLMKDVKNRITSLLETGSDHETIKDEMKDLAKIDIDAEGKVNFEKNGLKFSEEDLICDPIGKELDRNTVSNAIDNALDNAKDLDDFKDYLDAKGIEVATQDNKLEYKINGREVKMGIENFTSYIENQIKGDNNIDDKLLKGPKKVNDKDNHRGGDEEEEEIRRRNQNQGYSM